MLVEGHPLEPVVLDDVEQSDCVVLKPPAEHERAVDQVAERWVAHLAPFKAEVAAA